uniref:Secreted protein n=1 Tax=Picea glauca TaxID=3330 RepID=A0A101M1H4_PICGL|nr:hypothetical protein ABT39_MTgene3778 [Picea glauca]QHR86060.1 hypothetical protein Q903MT_gene58 [Picea sitchensis]
MLSWMFWNRCTIFITMHLFLKVAEPILYHNVYNASLKTYTSSGIGYHRQLPHLPRKVFPSFTD